MQLDQERESIQKLSQGHISHKDLNEDKKSDKKEDLSLIERALGDKLKNNLLGNQPQDKKNNYGILTEILPYSDRR